MRKLKKLFNLNVYQWLAKQARPHWKVLVLIIFLNMISAVSSVVGAVVSKQLIDLAVEHKLQQAIVYALIFGSLLLSKIGFNAIIALKTAQVREKMSYQMQSDFIEHLYHVEWLELNKHHSGDILTRLTSDVSRIVNGCVVVFPNMLALGVQLMTAFGTLLYYDKMLALFAFLLGPVSIILSWFISRKLKEMQHQIQAAESKYRSYLHEAVQNMLIVKTFGYEKESLQRIKSFQQIKHLWVMKLSRFSVSVNIVMGLGYRLGFFLAFSWGAFRISTGSASFGTFAAFLQLVGQIQGPFEGLSSSLPQVISTVASAERLMTYKALTAETRNSNLHPCLCESVGLGMNNVSFNYEGDKHILTKASFQVKAGEIVALIGLSGEGKTTIIRMLLALLKPKEGSLYIEGNTSGRILITTDTRPSFSYVPQGNTLFSGTIAENLWIGCPTASEQDIRDALESSCAWQFVQCLPNGIHTVIGERGLGLSEGQAQRLSIARALLKKSPILLLDEATSALDRETECAVLDNIRNLQPSRTCITITHRATVFEVCDHVYRLSDGILSKQNGAVSIS